MNLFQVIRSLPLVARVKNFKPDHEQPLNCLFFVCPKLSPKGIRLNSARTGLRARYEEGASAATIERVQRALRFAQMAQESGIGVKVTAIFANADALILFPLAADPPSTPTLAVSTVSNLAIVRDNLPRFARLYDEEPWKTAPLRVQRQEEERLTSFLPKETADYIRQDFIKRIFAGFALDGILLREEKFGTSPVLLGVETSEVAILQNAGLPKELWLPVIELL